MKQVVIFVSGGVADYSCDADVDVLVVDFDNLKAGDTVDIKGFEHLIPESTREEIMRLQRD